MKFSLPREVLLATLQNVMGAVERKQTKPILGYVLIQCDSERLTLTATDLEIELQASVDLSDAEHGMAALPARKLFDICKALPEDAVITLSADGERANVNSGRSRFTLCTMPTDEFPVLEEVPISRESSIPERELKRLIERTSFAMANQDVRYYLNGLMIEATPEHMRAVATDGHRLSLAEFAGSPGIDEACQVILPRKGVMELMRLLEPADQTIRIGFGNSHLRIQLPGVRFTSKLIDGRFPDYGRVIPVDGDKIVTVRRELLRQALGRAAILSNEKYRGVRLVIEDGALRVQAHNPEQEEAEDIVEIEYAEGPVEIGFNANYLLDALGAVEGDLVEIVLKDAGSSAVIRAPGDASARYVVMPMRL